MDGLFYNHDLDGITFFLFYSDGRVISFGKSTKYDQPLQTFPGFKVDSDIIHFSRGFYKVDIWDSIVITVKGNFGKIVYDGYIRDEYIDLYYRCPFTNIKKSATYTRFSEEHHIIHFKLHQSILN